MENKFFKKLMILLGVLFCGGCCAENEGNKDEVYTKFNAAKFDLDKIKLLRNLFTEEIATELFLSVDNQYGGVKRYLLQVMQEEKQKKGKDNPVTVIDYAKKKAEEEEQRKILEQEKIKKEEERKAKEEQEYKEKAQKQKEDAKKKRSEKQENNKKDAEIESAISGKEVTFNPNSNAKAYATYQEAFSEVESKYPFNKTSIVKADVDVWADTLTSLKGYIKNESTKDRGFLNNISSKNKALFDKAQKQIALTTSLLFSAKQGRLANKEQQLKATLDNLNKLKIELKPVTTGLLKDFEITQNIKNLLIKVIDQLISSCNNVLNA